MSTDEARIKKKLFALSGSLDDLETILEPLFSKSLPETVLGLETIQQAKLQTVLPYLVYDLIFIYLKTKGVEPKTHPVVNELDRVREYFNKITEAEDASKKKPTIDKDAAERFIKHAIAQATYDRPAPHIPTEANASSSTLVPTKVTSKMLERAEYERRVKEEEQSGEAEDEGMLEVIGDNIPEAIPDEASDEQEVMEVTLAAAKDKGKGKAEDEDEDEDVNEDISGKRKRSPVEEQLLQQEDNASSSRSSSTSNKKKREQKGKGKALSSAVIGVQANAPEAKDSKPKKGRKKTKKQ